MEGRAFSAPVNDSIRTLRLLILSVFSLAFLCYVVSTWHWMLVCDSAIMHYVDFLMAHGLKPYREITDNNLPGSYLTEWLAMHVFGPGDLGWRVYEFFLAVVLTAALVLIAAPVDWVAGVFAGGMFLMLHAKEGPWWTIEREQVMTVILVLGYAALFTSIRRREPRWLLAMGFLTAFAASIKPTMAPLGPTLLIMAVVVLRRRRLRVARYVVYGLLGMFAATLVNVLFLTWHHAWADFFFTQRLITTYYVGLRHLDLHAMLLGLSPPFILLLGAAGAVLALKNRRWTWEHWALLVGAVVGALSYFQQHKGYYAHRYLFVTMLLLLASMELLRGLRNAGWQRLLSATVILAALVLYVPRAILDTYHIKPTSDLTLALQDDLNRYGGTSQLQGQVQCLDLVYGCLNALYRLRLVENTGFTGDMIVFDENDSAARRFHRALWWRLAQQNPAEVLVLSNEYFQGGNSFDKVDHWPAYQRFLAKNYTLTATRYFPDESGRDNETFDPRLIHGYRLYVHHGSPLLGVKLGGPGPDEVDTLPPGGSAAMDNAGELKPGK